MLLDIENKSKCLDYEMWLLCAIPYLHERVKCSYIQDQTYQKREFISTKMFNLQVVFPNAARRKAFKGKEHFILA